MSKTYKILAEKYALIVEGEPWNLLVNGAWVSYIKKSGLPHTPEYIKWINNYGEQFAINRYNMPPGAFCADDFFEFLYIKHEDITTAVSKLYKEGFLPWREQEQKRLAALNKDNPGIEMDI